MTTDVLPILYMATRSFREFKLLPQIIRYGFLLTSSLKENTRKYFGHDAVGLQHIFLWNANTHLCEIMSITLIQPAKRRYLKEDYFEARFRSQKTWALLNEFRTGNSGKSPSELLSRYFRPDFCCAASFLHDYFWQCSWKERISYSPHTTLHNPNLFSAHLRLMTNADLYAVLHI